MTQVLGPIMLDVAGTTLSDDEREILAHPQVGGVILFARNTPSASATQSLIREIREVSPDILVAIDQEGGRVQRLKEGVTNIPPMAEFGKLYPQSAEEALRLTQDAGWLLGMEMAACGFDITFAPVLDLDDNQSPAIGSRSFSSDPELATQLANVFIDGLHEAGMVAVGKHFPGHGGVHLDTHHDIAEDARSLAELRAKDLIPFMRLSDKLDAVMPAHVVFSSFDHRPAGFSPSWLGMLRQEFGFKGVIFSDDLTMAAAHAAGTPIERAEAAWAAGCDMALICNAPEDALSVVHASKQPLNNKLSKLRYARARPSLESLEAISRWRRTHARLTSMSHHLA